MIKKFTFSLKNVPAASLISSNRPFDDKFELENIINQPRESDKNDFILPKNQENSEYILFSENEIYSYFGNLIPVQSGHNGCLSDEESNILDFHLKNSGFMKN